MVVTSTQMVSNPSALPSSNRSNNNEKSSGLSKTNQIVVGVVVGVGGSILIAIIALLFYFKRRSNNMYEGSGGWTFWRKGEKANDDFLSGELGVRDRNINAGSNF